MREVCVSHIFVVKARIFFTALLPSTLAKGIMAQKKKKKSAKGLRNCFGYCIWAGVGLSVQLVDKVNLYGGKYGWSGKKQPNLWKTTDHFERPIYFYIDQQVVNNFCMLPAWPWAALFLSDNTLKEFICRNIIKLQLRWEENEVHNVFLKLMSWNISFHYVVLLAKFILVSITSLEYFIAENKEALQTEKTDWFAETQVTTI